MLFNFDYYSFTDPTQIDWGNEKEEESPPPPQQQAPVHSAAVSEAAGVVPTFKCTALYSYTVSFKKISILRSTT